MGLFEIITDSAVNLPDSYRVERDIHVIPFRYIADGIEYNCLEEGVPFQESAKKFYALLKSGADIKTSLVSEAQFTETAEPLLKAGKDVLFLTIASGISGTFNQAKAAAEALMKKYPDRTVIAVDSANASMGQGLLALKAADLRDMGESCQAAADWLKANVYKLNSYLTVGDLKYLKKSGRISTLVAIAGTLLSIKPIIKADGGEIPKLAVCGREHGRKKAISAILKAFTDNAIEPETQVVAITHADCEEDALALAEEVKKLGVKDVIIEYYDICTGAHAGPGTLALFFVGKDRRGDLAPAEARTGLKKKARAK
ncbi:MAG: DegV family protein [Clostridia bacterium]|nr:DegV family protein [Clostridia bacterium]